MGTRGSVEQRRREAEQAAETLGAEELVILDLGDGGLRHSRREEDTLIAELRRLGPELVLGPTPADRHPDHGRAHRLVEDACFYAGLARRGAGAPHRPAAVFCYMQHDPFDPSFVVDVTSTWQAKVRALTAYTSQLYQGGVETGDPETKISTREFAAAVEGRARHFGQLIGAEFGEPFWSRLPLAVGDPLALLPGGVR
jgi:bacillithiol biosynthesis deacetylase BshB1